jgi:cobalamin synthase
VINSEIIESRLFALRRKREMLPPFVHDTLKWLRIETVLPFGSAPRGDDGEAIPESPGDGAYAAPLAAAAGAFGAAALLICFFLRLPSLVVAAVALLALAAIRGARLESGMVRGGDRLSATAGTGAATLMLLMLVEVAALAGLIVNHAPSAALVVIAAAIFGSSAAIVFRLTQPARPLGEVGEGSRPSNTVALQGLTLITIVACTALLLPVYRIGPTAAAFVAALSAFVCVVAIAKNQHADDVADCSAVAGKTTEVAAIFAVLIFVEAS